MNIDILNDLNIFGTILYRKELINSINIKETITNMINNNKINKNEYIKIFENKTKLDKILENLNINILFNFNTLNLKDFNCLYNIPGVWALWGINKETKIKCCLTVGQTKNLGKELNWTLKVLTNQNLQNLEKEKFGITGRWDKIQKYYKDYEYILVNKNESNIKMREIIELTYAIENNSIYWKPSITQKHLFNTNFKFEEV